MRDVAESIMALSDEELERDYRNSNEDAKKIIYELVKVARARRANQTVGEVAAEKIFELLGNTNGVSLSWTQTKVKEVIERWAAIIDETVKEKEKKK